MGSQSRTRHDQGSSLPPPNAISWPCPELNSLHIQCGENLFQGRSQDITLGVGVLSPGHGERGTASPYTYGSGAEPPVGMPPVGSQEAKPHEAEISVAFEAPAEEPNLTLVVDSFLPRNAL